MKVEYISSINRFNEENEVLALGYFDGVHIGHQKVLLEALKTARELGIKSSVLTFNESVKEYLKKTNPRYLTCLDTKLDILQKMGFDSVHVVELTDEFVNQTKDEFIERFLEGAKMVVCGFDYTFGKCGEGNTDYLKSKMTDRVKIVEREEMEDEKIGTTQIVSFLKDGNIEEAERFMGRKYLLEGTIHRKNKTLSFLSLNYLIKSGRYRIEISDGKNTNAYSAKLKCHPDEGEIIIRLPIEDYINFLPEKHKRYKITIHQSIKPEDKSDDMNEK